MAQKRFRVSAREIYRASSAMEAEYRNMMRVLSNLEAGVNRAVKTWEGIASDTFIGKYRALRVNVDRFVNTAIKYSRTLNDVGNVYTAQELKTATDISALPTT